jgi:hypothetical protein
MPARARFVMRGPLGKAVHFGENVCLRRRKTSPPNRRLRSRKSSSRRLLRRGPRSQRAKLLGLVQGNRAFRGFKVDESWTDAQFASAVKDFMANSQVQPITQSGARLRAPERE